MRQWLEKYKPYFPAIFFVLGFLFDLFTLARIDETFQLVQQFVYLLVIGILLVYEKSPGVERFFSTGRRVNIWNYRVEVIHFLLGALLSVYMIFYFKSSSIWNSFIFIGVMAALLVLNEVERVKGLGDVIRFSLFSLCSASYFICLVPILWQHVGFFTFLFSLTMSGIFIVFFLHRISKFDHLSNNYLFTRIMAPSVAVHVLFFVLYIFRLLPPVPLSIEKIGIYHDIQKTGGEYQLHYDRPYWKIWESGAQTFTAHAGDKVYCFASIFAPNFFKDQVRMEWWLKGKNGWTKTDSIPMQISGGRDKGFRGYTVKVNYDPGEWQIRVVTSDAREIGRIYVTIEKTHQLSPADREFHLDTY